MQSTGRPHFMIFAFILQLVWCSVVATAGSHTQTAVTTLVDLRSRGMMPRHDVDAAAPILSVYTGKTSRTSSLESFICGNVCRVHFRSNPAGT